MSADYDDSILNYYHHFIMDQSPLIFLQTKSTDDVDFNHGIKSTIANVYGEDPSNYNDTVAALNRYRQDATRGATTDATGRSYSTKMIALC